MFYFWLGFLTGMVGWVHLATDVLEGDKSCSRGGVPLSGRALVWRCGGGCVGGGTFTLLLLKISAIKVCTSPVSLGGTGRMTSICVIKRRRPATMGAAATGQVAGSNRRPLCVFGENRKRNFIVVSNSSYLPVMLKCARRNSCSPRGLPPTLLS